MRGYGFFDFAAEGGFAQNDTRNRPYDYSNCPVNQNLSSPNEKLPIVYCAFF